MNNMNRLADEPSPYLRQHADNPVHWWPWCDEAFEEAQRRDVPVFLSIGYATCHWCHVMAHESFEDDDVAGKMNDAFVCIKVDREERPDIDAAYMAACQASGQRGGWPLTAVLDHEKRPWFLGTYLPKLSRGRIGMLDLIPKLTDAWIGQREEVEKSAAHLIGHVEKVGAGDDRSNITMDLVDQAVAQSKTRFDAENGGFGEAPKFPSPQQLLLLLRHHRRTKDADSLHMALTTLTAMANGGIHDHVGGGFHRYSTDREWHLPHFEKMLYDQAMLMMAYAEAFQVTKDENYANVVDDIARYVLRDLRHSDGGFYCAEDADSDGEEGTFYIWTAVELRDHLATKAADFMETFGCKEGGNFVDEATREPHHSNILHLKQTGESSDFFAELQILFQVREQRNRPLLDDKILTDWNGLMIAALTRAGAALGRENFTSAAVRAAEFALANLRTKGGELRHRWHAGRTDNIAFLDDHAFLAWGLLELHQATQETRWLEAGVEVATQMQKEFANADGRLCLTRGDGEAMVVDATKAYDGAMPSGTSVAIQVFEKLGRLTANAKWTEAAWKATENVPNLTNHPSAFEALLLAVPGLTGQGLEVVVTGDGPIAHAMLEELRTGHHPDAVVVHRPQNADGLPEWIIAHDGAVDAAFICRQQSCDAPVNNLESLRAALQT